MVPLIVRDFISDLRRAPADRTEPGAVRQPAAQQAKRVLAVIACGVALFCAFGVGCIKGYYKFNLISADLVSLTKLPAYAGVLSTLGLLVWAFTGGLCLFTVAFVRRAAGRTDGLLLAIGLLSLTLLADDWLMLHEHFFPKVLHLPEKLLLGSEMLAMLWILVAYRTRLTGVAVPLVLALGLFFLSECVDQLATTLFAHTSNVEYFLEDGFKFWGILAWAVTFGYVCAAALRERDVIVGLSAPADVTAATVGQAA